MLFSIIAYELSIFFSLYEGFLHIGFAIMDAIMAASGIKEIKYINDYKNDKNVMKLSQLSDVRICKILL